MNVFMAQARWPQRYSYQVISASGVQRAAQRCPILRKYAHRQGELQLNVRQTGYHDSFESMQKALEAALRNRHGVVHGYLQITEGIKAESLLGDPKKLQRFMDAQRDVLESLQAMRQGYQIYVGYAAGLLVPEEGQAFSATYRHHRDMVEADTSRFAAVHRKIVSSVVTGMLQNSARSIRGKGDLGNLTRQLDEFKQPLVAFAGDPVGRFRNWDGSISAAQRRAEELIARLGSQSLAKRPKVP